jgi:putative ABC transport system substrate-binding protein
MIGLRDFITLGASKGLSETGFVEGRNVVIDFCAANSDRVRLLKLAADVVRRRVAVIVAAASPTA